MTSRTAPWGSGPASTAFTGAILVLVFLAPFLVRVDLDPQPSFPAGDEAILELATRRASAGEQWVGPYSRYRWNHPGPLYFYLQLPFYENLQRQYSDLRVGALALAAVGGAGILVLTLRFGGAALAAWTMLLLVGYFRALDPELTNAWNPNVTIVSFGLHVMLCAALAMGSVRALPVAALNASFLVQTHVGHLPAVAGVLVAAGGLAWCGRRSLGTATAIRSAAISVVVLGVVWRLPLLDELAHRPGNLSRLVEFFSSAHGAQHSWTEATFLVLAGLGGVWARAFVPGPLPELAPVPGMGGGVFLGIAEVALLVGAVSASRRRDRSYAMVLCTLCLAATLVAVWSVTRIIGDVHGYLVRWITILGLCNACALGAAVLPRAATGSFLARRGPAMLLLFAAGAHVLSQAAAPSVGALRDPVVENLSPRIAEWLDRRSLRRPRFRILSPPAWAASAGVLLQLEKAGIPVSVERRWLFAFGREHAEAEDDDSTLVIAVEAERDRLESLPGYEAIGGFEGVIAYGAPHRGKEQMLLADVRLDRVSERPLRELRALYEAEGRRERSEWADRLLRRRFTPRNVLDLDFGSEIRLLGYDWKILGPRRFEMTWFWQALRPTAWSYAAFVHFDGPGFRFQDDHFLQGRDSTTADWAEGDVVKEVRSVIVPDDAPPGTYVVRLGVWEPAQRRHLRLPDERRSKDAVLFELSVPLPDGADQNAVMPPSTGRVTPVM